MESPEETFARIMAENVELQEYSPTWPARFEEEKTRLLAVIPADLIHAIEHFGSTSIPGLAAKPIIDMLVEVSDAERARTVFPGVLGPQGYDCIPQPEAEEQIYLCIRRDNAGRRTHHLHIGTPGFKASEQAFRDILLAHPEAAAEYGRLKRRLAREYHNDRLGYTEAKTEFIRRIMEQLSGPQNG